MTPLISPLILLFLIKQKEQEDRLFKGIEGIKKTQEPTSCACSRHDDQPHN
ncbi:MAG TPA: hypothetical protein PLR18_00135 [bacterium]|nr:hypothetical protein [bacterium]